MRVDRVRGRDRSDRRYDRDGDAYEDRPASMEYWDREMDAVYYEDPEDRFVGEPDYLEEEPAGRTRSAGARRGGARREEMPYLGNTDYIDFASVICAITVVILHTNGCFWTFSATESYWPSSNVVENLFYCAVPVFYMISATTLVDYRERYDTGTFFKKRAVKTLIPYLFWSIMGLLLKIFFLNWVTLEEVTPAYVLTRLGEGSLIGVYWFFIPLFSIYLCIPLFAAVPEELRKRLFTYIAVAAFIVCSLIPFVISIFNLQITTSLTVYVGAEYLIYVPIGYLLSHYEIKPAVRGVLYALGVAGLLMMILGTYVLSMAAGTVIDTYKGYTNVPCILFSVAVFLFYQQVGNRVMRVRWVRKVIGFLREYTFSLYLLHWFLIQIYVARCYPDIYTVFYRLVLPFPIIAIIIVIAFIVKKIPVIKHLLP